MFHLVPVLTYLLICLWLSFYRTASFKKVAVVKALPKTRSGKTLRSTMSKIANGEEYKITPTIDDPKIFDYLEPVIQKLMGRKLNDKPHG